MSIFGYVDPGVGLLAWQTLVAFFVGLLFYLKKTRTWMANAFNRVFRPSMVPASKKSPTSPAPQEGELIHK